MNPLNQYPSTNLWLDSESSVPTYDMETTAMAHMDEESTINSALSNLEIQRNSVCFISRLPTETLEEVFIHGPCDYYGACYGEDEGLVIPRPPSWVNVSYVCRHWRSVALNCATLWTYLFITSSRWTEELLARSKQAPLKLYVNLFDRENRSRGIRFLEEVISHVERIQELRLDLAFSHDSYQFISKLSSPAPSLQNLQIWFRGRPSEWWTSVPFGGDTLALRTLDLSHCTVPWYSLKLSGLTKLCLYTAPVRFQQNTADFLATLKCMQDLTYLCLEDALASAADFLSSTAFNTFQKFNLSHLSYFDIDAPVSTVIALLSCVNIPLRTEILLHCRVEYDFPSPDHYSLLSSFLAQRLATSEDQALSSLTFRSLVIAFPRWGAQLTFSVTERDCDGFFAVACMGTVCSIPDEEDGDRPLIVTLDRDESMTTIDWDYSISHICCPVALSDLRSVHVLNPPSPLTFWMRVLGCIQDLRYMKLGKGDMPNLAAVLSVTPRDGTENHADQDPNQIYAPALEELELYELVFQTMVEGDIDPLKVAGVRSLCDALATRKEPRGRLTMTGCTVRNPDGQKKQFDMEGGWEGGRFHIVELKVESDT
ncbi:hypothetical protein OG21DRAFT_913670 [Imleria badia]|nr:hypothetical protein OG21DRAFT_913670 [Imleria badia]